MLGAAEADALCAVLARLLRLPGRVGVGPHLRLQMLVDPLHEGLVVFVDLRHLDRHFAEHDDDLVAVDGEPLALLDDLVVDLHLLADDVDLDLLAAADAGLAHLAADDDGVRGRAADHGDDALGRRHTVDVVGAGLLAHEDDVLALVRPGHRVIGVEDDAADAGAGGADRALGERSELRVRGERRVEHLLDLVRVDLADRLALRDEPLVHEVDRNLERGARGALAVAGLEHVELVLLDRELEILHVAVVLLEDVADFQKFLVGLRHVLRQALLDLLARADAGDDVLTLGVDEVLSVEIVLARRRVAGEGDAGGRGVAEVAEDHRLHVHGGAEVVRDLVHVAVDDGARVVPGAEDGVPRLAQLLHRVLREILATDGLVDRLEGLDDLLPVLGLHLGVFLVALLAFVVAQGVLELRLLDVLRHVAEHGDEAAVGVPGEARVAALLLERDDRLVVEAEVEDRVHHAGHRELRARAHGDEKRVHLAAELLAGDLLEEAQVLLHLGVELLRDLPAEAVVFAADLGGDGETGEADAGHLGEVRALAAEQVLHVALALGVFGAEEIDHLLRHRL